MMIADLVPPPKMPSQPSQQSQQRPRQPIEKMGAGRMGRLGRQNIAPYIYIDPSLYIYSLIERECPSVPTVKTSMGYLEHETGQERFERPEVNEINGIRSPVPKDCSDRRSDCEPVCHLCPVNACLIPDCPHRLTHPPRQQDAPNLQNEAPLAGATGVGVPPLCQNGFLPLATPPATRTRARPSYAVYCPCGQISTGFVLAPPRHTRDMPVCRACWVASYRVGDPAAPPAVRATWSTSQPPMSAARAEPPLTPPLRPPTMASERSAAPAPQALLHAPPRPPAPQGSLFE